MKQKPGRSPREPRESSLASGWTVEAEPTTDDTATGRGPAPQAPGADAVASDTATAAASTTVGAAPSVTGDVDADAEPESTGADTASDSSRSATEHDAAAGGAATVSAPQLSNGALVVLGVFGGLYLLYTWGWFIVAQAYSAVNAVTAAGSGVIGGVLQQIVFWAAPLAAPLWFFTALALSRGGRTRRLAILLVIGAVVLVPLPMLIARGA